MHFEIYLGLNDEVTNSDFVLQKIEEFKADLEGMYQDNIDISVKIN